MKVIKSKIANILLFCSIPFFLSGTPSVNKSNCSCEEPLSNVWYKVSTDDLTYGDVIRLDMSKGQAFSDPIHIYLVAKDLDTGEVILMAFPNGGDWYVLAKEDSIYMDMEKDIDDLQKYLEKRGSKELKRKH
jgi:hypothetical protein